MGPFGEHVVVSVFEHLVEGAERVDAVSRLVETRSGG
jgi:hypothetical protein